MASGRAFFGAAAGAKEVGGAEEGSTTGNTGASKTEAPPGLRRRFGGKADSVEVARFIVGVTSTLSIR
jgi:hypothetical protein